ncbi:uncharacterized protein B0J16DRAFT_314546 [Fusarium flagelliforme]|uniref:uncharacterized protein n=1 Tax=Fusarium flagelliforme TaxID=2675880 RepID=UPI001E8EAAD5|nr:uncharacterized protein B0J16DRAFT_314546 [Fusarium flagelliforme]KAH7198238.1 hypothetical protein B0J16DRAFT_314546 [Fusarium flagelliforme]
MLKPWFLTLVQLLSIPARKCRRRFGVGITASCVTDVPPRSTLLYSARKSTGVSDPALWTGEKSFTEGNLRPGLLESVKVQLIWDPLGVSFLTVCEHKGVDGPNKADSVEWKYLTGRNMMELKFGYKGGGDLRDNRDWGIEYIFVEAYNLAIEASEGSGVEDKKSSETNSHLFIESEAKHIVE